MQRSFNTIQALDNVYWTTDMVDDKCFVVFNPIHVINCASRLNPTKRRGLLITGIGQNKGYTLEVNSNGKIVELLKGDG